MHNILILFGNIRTDCETKNVNTGEINSFFQKIFFICQEFKEINSASFP